MLGPDHCKSEDHRRKASLEHLRASSSMELQAEGQCLRALSHKERERFKRHCLAGHRPWRSDCAACVEAMAFARPHRRLSRSRACCLSVDVSGPHKSSGTEDQDVAKPKYFMVGCYTYPVFDKADGKGEAAEFPTEGAECFKDEAEDKVEGATVTPEGVDTPLEELPAEDWERPEAPAPVPKPITSEHRKRLDADYAKWAEIAKAICCRERMVHCCEHC